jgi:hypothetical protein
MYEIIDNEDAAPIYPHCGAEIFGRAEYDKRGRAWHPICAADDISHLGIFFYARDDEPQDRV